jgi:hypothetical protein
MHFLMRISKFVILVFLIISLGFTFFVFFLNPEISPNWLPVSFHILRLHFHDNGSERYEILYGLYNSINPKSYCSDSEIQSLGNFSPFLIKEETGLSNNYKYRIIKNPKAEIVDSPELKIGEGALILESREYCIKVQNEYILILYGYSIYDRPDNKVFELYKKYDSSVEFLIDGTSLSPRTGV